MNRILAGFLSLFTVCVLTAFACAQPAPHGKLADATFNTTALQPGQEAVAAIVLDIEDGFHAQSHTPSEPTFIKFVAKADPNPGLTIYDPIYPAGEEKEYPNLGKLNVYTGRVIVFVPIQVKSDAATGPMKFSGTLRYQCCDENACYPPSKTPFTIETTIVPAGQKVEAQKPELFKDFDPKVFSHLAPQTQPATQPSTAPSGGTEALGLGAPAAIQPRAQRFLESLLPIPRICSPSPPRLSWESFSTRCRVCFRCCR